MSTGLIIDSIVLAAGESSRLGEPKQLVKLGGEFLLERAVRASSEAATRRTVIVLGAFNEQIKPFLSGGPGVVLLNPDWKEGIASSVRCGITELLRDPPDAFFLLLCDQPFVAAHHLDEMIDRFTSEQPLAVAAQYDGRFGVPALVDWSLAPTLLKLRGQQGAREVLREDGMRVLGYHLPSVGFDVDTSDDLKRLRDLDSDENT